MMATTGEIAITSNITGPKRVTVDGLLVEQYDLEQLIAADKYLGSKNATLRGLGVKITRVEPPGATG